MIPQPIVRRVVSRAIRADTTVDERASIPCFRHHGYASASQIVSRPASSIARADASISSSGSMVSCITPTRKGTAIEGGLALVFRGGRRPFRLWLVRLRGERADPLVRAARPRVRLRVLLRICRRPVVLRAFRARRERALHFPVESRED